MFFVLSVGWFACLPLCLLVCLVLRGKGENPKRGRCRCPLGCRQSPWERWKPEAASLPLSVWLSSVSVGKAKARRGGRRRVGQCTGWVCAELASRSSRVACPGAAAAGLYDVASTRWRARPLWQPGCPPQYLPVSRRACAGAVNAEGGRESLVEHSFGDGPLVQCCSQGFRWESSLSTLFFCF